MTISGRATVRAIKLTEGIRLDGRLDEAVYSTVPPVTNFIQQMPVDGAPATEKTDAWIMFDKTNVYVSGRIWDSAPPSQWIANEMRRDASQLRENDVFGVSSTRSTIGATGSTSTRPARSTCRSTVYERRESQ